MAYSLNRASLLGNVGADPEQRDMNSGDTVVNIRIATSESWKDRDGERQEKTQWHNVVCFNQPLNEIIMNHVKKGSKVLVEGQIETRKWTDQSGNDRYTTEIVLRPFNSNLIILDPKTGGKDRGQADHDYDEGRSERQSSGRGRGKRADEEEGSSGFGFGGGGRPQPAAFDTDLDDDVPFISMTYDEQLERRIS